MKPVLPNVKLGNAPVAGSPPKEIKWSFSFQYFRQIEYFGLADTEAKWYVSLLDRLKDLSSQKVDALFRDYTLREAYRFHRIDWTAKNVPIQRQEFNWIEKDVLENDDEFPFYQFQISQALGRVVGILI